MDEKGRDMEEKEIRIGELVVKQKKKPRKYEGMFLLSNLEVRKGWDHAKGLVLNVLERYGAKIVSARMWAERKLAYEIKKQKRATYFLVYFECLPENIAPINRELELTDGVLRHLILVLEEFPELAFQPVEEDFDASQVPLGDEEEEEEKGETLAEAGLDEDIYETDDLGFSEEYFEEKNKEETEENKGDEKS